MSQCMAYSQILDWVPLGSRANIIICEGHDFFAVLSFCDSWCERESHYLGIIPEPHLFLQFLTILTILSLGKSRKLLT